MNQLLLLGLVFFALQGAKAPPKDLPAPDPDRDPIDGSQEPVDTPPECNITQGYYTTSWGEKRKMNTDRVLMSSEGVEKGTYYLMNHPHPDMLQPGVSDIWVWVDKYSYGAESVEPYKPFNYTIESDCA